VPQVLINREPLRHLNFDVELLGDCDVIVNELCHRLGGHFTELCSTLSPSIEITADDVIALPTVSDTDVSAVQSVNPASSLEVTENRTESVDDVGLPVDAVSAPVASGSSLTATDTDENPTNDIVRTSRLSVDAESDAAEDKGTSSQSPGNHVNINHSSFVNVVHDTEESRTTEPLNWTSLLKRKCWQAYL